MDSWFLLAKPGLVLKNCHDRLIRSYDQTTTRLSPRGAKRVPAATAGAAVAVAAGVGAGVAVAGAMGINVGVGVGWGWGWL